MAVASKQMARSWFRGRGGRRFALEFTLILVVKLVLLALLWLFLVRAQPRADTSPGAIERHFTPAAVESAP